MASSGPMDDKAFSDRVKKTFGSLFASIEPSPASLSNPLWSLTDAQVEKKEWRRDKDTSNRDSNPCSSSFDEFLSQARKNSRKNIKNYRKELLDDLQDLEDDVDDDDADDEVGGDSGDADLNDWDVKSSIGLDSTLDNEEEEDAFDKVATGRENAGDRLYMRNVKGGDSGLHFFEDDLPGAVDCRERDPRANHWAACIRLKEDDIEAAAQTEKHKPGQPSSTSGKDSAMSTEGLDKLKPILKRKEHESTSKPSKRVRFDPLFVSNDDCTGDVPSKNTSAETMNQDDISVLNDKGPRVPDYLQNPSNYTRYSLESTEELSNTSNTNAFMDFIEMVKEKNKGSGSDSDVPADLSKSIAFVPKKKSDTSKGVLGEASQQKGSDAKLPTLQATFLDVAAEQQETEVGDMEVDEAKTSVDTDKGILFKKQGRQYRTKPQGEEPA